MLLSMAVNVKTILNYRDSAGTNILGSCFDWTGNSAARRQKHVQSKQQAVITRGQGPYRPAATRAMKDGHLVLHVRYEPYGFENINFNLHISSIAQLVKC